ncbi:MAG: undecaprenyldiphospho-muramoylpentapeptide beta-N-acetylglucosaminyltransferase [Candidatus Altimarinota bacterium]
MHHKIKEALSKYKSIILVGGGTGGHIQPILNILPELNEKNLLWIGGKDSNESREATQVQVEFESIPTLKLATTFSPKIFLYPIYLWKGFLEAKKILKKYRSDTCLFSKGGPGSVAVGIAAWSLKIPIYIHESDTIPGRSNLILSKFATKIFLGFQSSIKYFPKEKSEFTGQILHSTFYTKKDIQGTIHWKTQKTHILVICGSQGAKTVFESIIKQFPGITDFEWIISLGKLNAHMKSDFEKMNSTQSFDWIGQENIASLLRETDIAITRGSATTLAEIDAFSVKKIIIPLPSSARNHQLFNAKEYEKKGDIVLEQKDITLLKVIIEKLCQRK